MKDESRWHQALAAGATAFAIFGFVAGASPAVYQPPPVPPIATVVNPDEGHAEQVAQPIFQFQQKETPTGSPPTNKYFVQMSGPQFYKDYHVEVPSHQASPLFWGTLRPLSALSPENQIHISYQPTQDAPHFQLAVPVEFLQGYLADHTGEPVHIDASKVSQIQITPAPAHSGEILTLDLNAKESGVDWDKLIGAIASALSIIDKVAEQVEKRGKKKRERRSAGYGMEGDSIVQTAADGARETVLTKAALETASENDRQLITAWTGRIQALYSRWVALYTPEPGAAEAEAQLTEVQHSMCEVFGNLKKFLERTGKPLAGYEAIQAVCEG